MKVHGLSADSRELYLELVKHTERLVQLGFDVWHVCMEGIFVSTAVVTLENFYFSRSYQRGWGTAHETGHHTP